ncbi:unnamed protein product, partial [Nesidiocoris tenuis]
MPESIWVLTSFLANLCHYEVNLGLFGASPSQSGAPTSQSGPELSRSGGATSPPGPGPGQSCPVLSQSGTLLHTIQLQDVDCQTFPQVGDRQPSLSSDSSSDICRSPIRRKRFQ